MAAEWDSWTTEWIDIERILQRADPGEITRAFGRNLPNMSRGRWLTERHQMRDPRHSLRGKPSPHARLLTQRIAEYAAASVPLHVSDAWTYFGRAMSALAMGAPEVAQHLLYYSELRAAQAILSRHGVLILAGQKMVVRPEGTERIPITGRAGHNDHQSLWVAFEGWSKLASATGFCGGVLSVSGSTIQEWISNRPVSASLGSVISPLLQGWGLDLRRFSDDRNLRNHLSYDPTRLELRDLGISPKLIGSLYEQVWALLEPGAGNPFEALDTYISRQAFEAIELKGGSSSRTLASAAYKKSNRVWAENVLGKGRSDFMTDFLQRPYSSPEPEILRLAGTDVSNQMLSTQLTGMVGRATILLRLATGALRDLVSSAGATVRTVDFWVKDMLAIHGIESPAGNPVDYADLFREVSETLVDIEPLRLLASSSDIPHMKSTYGTPIETLSGFERVPAWSVT